MAILACQLHGINLLFASGKLYMTQAFWQGTGNHVNLESNTDLNNYLATKVSDGNYDFTNFFEVNNVCNNGLVLKDALDLFFNEPAPVSNCLGTNEQLVVGEHLQSNNGLYRARLDEDGRLCVYDTDGSTSSNWCTGAASGISLRNGTSAPGGPGILKMQGDGNLVLYTQTEFAYWDSNSYGADSYLVLQNDRNLVVYPSGGSATWACSVNRDNTCFYVTDGCVDCSDNVCQINTGTTSPSKSPTMAPNKSPLPPTNPPTVSKVDCICMPFFLFRAGHSFKCYPLF